MNMASDASEDVARKLVGATTRTQIAEMESELAEMLRKFLSEGETFCFNRGIVDDNGIEVTILVDFGITDLEEDNYDMASIHTREDLTDPWRVNAFSDAVGVVEGAVAQAMDHWRRMSWDVTHDGGETSASAPIVFNPPPR